MPDISWKIKGQQPTQMTTDAKGRDPQHSQPYAQELERLKNLPVLPAEAPAGIVRSRLLENVTLGRDEARKVEDHWAKIRSSRFGSLRFAKGLWLSTHPPIFGTPR